MKSKASVAALCACIVAGCVAYHPRDIAVVSVEAVDNREVAELGAPVPTGSPPAYVPYHEFLSTLLLKSAEGGPPVTPADMEPYFRRQKNNQAFKNAKEKKPILKIAFTSKENLFEYVKARKSHLSFRPFHCARGPEMIPWGGAVYARGLDLSVAPQFYSVALEEGETLTYYAYLSLSYNYLNYGVRKQFDWQTTPEDLCFRVGGGWIHNLHESNVAVIPKAAIAEALKVLPPAYRSPRPRTPVCPGEGMPRHRAPAFSSCP